MGAWDREILSEELSIEFLDELIELDDDEIVEGVADAIKVAVGDRVSDDELVVGYAAATIAAIWAGAPYSAGDIVADYPFIRNLAGEGDEQLRELASQLLEEADTEADLETYLEALS